MCKWLLEKKLYLTQYTLIDFDKGVLKELVNKSSIHSCIQSYFRKKKTFGSNICIIRNWKLNARNSTYLHTFWRTRWTTIFFCVLNNAFRSLVNFSLPNATNACCHVALSPLSSSTCFFTLKNSYAEGISCQIFLHSCMVCECNQANFF